MYRTFATLLDKTWQCLGFGATVVDDAIEVACLTRGIDRDALVREPSLMTIVNTNSPLRLDGPMSDGLIEMAKHGQPVVATPFTLAGAMTPATLAGALAQQNAEALFMVALAQIVRPGAPMVYGGFTSNVDMRTGSPAFGTPEYVKAAFATGQLARRYGLPWRSSNVTGLERRRRPGGVREPDVDLGRGHGRRQPALPGRGLARGRPDRVVREADPRRRDAPEMAEVLVPFRVDDAELGLDAIAEVGPGGHFFAIGPHARALRDRVLPADPVGLAELRDVAGGRRADRDASARTGIWKQLLAEYEPPPLDPAAAEALDAFVERRKREIETAL